MDHLRPSTRNALTIVLWASPYSGQWITTGLSIARAALDQGHRVSVHAAGDGVYSFTTGKGAKGLPNIASAMGDLFARGLAVHL